MKTVLAVLTAGVLLALAGCGGGSSTTTPAPGPPATTASPSPAPGTSTASPAPTVSWTWPPTTACGRERWPVKTGTDPDAGLIDLGRSTATTIAALSQLTPPSVLPQDARIKPVEVTQYSVTATLVSYKMESDSDYHLVLRDTAGDTMIAEVPDPACVGRSSPLLPGIELARSQVDARFHVSDVFQSANVQVLVTGIGFFDFKHGQDGVASNGIELHPVQRIEFSS